MNSSLIQTQELYPQLGDLPARTFHGFLSGLLRITSSNLSNIFVPILSDRFWLAWCRGIVPWISARASSANDSESVTRDTGQQGAFKGSSFFLFISYDIGTWTRDEIRPLVTCNRCPHSDKGGSCTGMLCLLLVCTESPISNSFYGNCHCEPTIEKKSWM